MKTFFIFSIFFVSAVLGVEFKTYDGYQVFRVKPHTQNDFHLLKTLELNGKIMFWENIYTTLKPARVMVSPVEIDSFERTLKANNIGYELEVENVAEYKLIEFFIT